MTDNTYLVIGIPYLVKYEFTIEVLSWRMIFFLFTRYIRVVLSQHYCVVSSDRSCEGNLR